MLSCRAPMSQETVLMANPSPTTAMNAHFLQCKPVIPVTGFFCVLNVFRL